MAVSKAVLDAVAAVAVAEVVFQSARAEAKSTVEGVTAAKATWHAARAEAEKAKAAFDEVKAAADLKVGAASAAKEAFAAAKEALIAAKDADGEARNAAREAAQANEAASEAALIEQLVEGDAVAQMEAALGATPTTAPEAEALPC